MLFVKRGDMRASRRLQNNCTLQAKILKPSRIRIWEKPSARFIGDDVSACGSVSKHSGGNQ